MYTNTDNSLGAQKDLVGNFALQIIEGTPLLLSEWLNGEHVSALAEFLLEIEPGLLELPRAPNWRDRAGNETSARYASYNVMILRNPLTKILYDVAKSGYLELLKRLNRPAESMYIQCWVNIARNGESLEPHAHPFPYHGHVTLQTDGSETIYGRESSRAIPNKLGLMTILGGPGLVHSVPAYQGHLPRVSVAFDLLPHSWVVCDSHWREVWEQRMFIPFD